MRLQEPELEKRSSRRISSTTCCLSGRKVNFTVQLQFRVARQTWAYFSLDLLSTECKYIVMSEMCTQEHKKRLTTEHHK